MMGRRDDRKGQFFIGRCLRISKRILKLDRFRLRGLSGPKDEVMLTATAQNLRRLAKLLFRAPPGASRLLSLSVASGLVPRRKLRSTTDAHCIEVVVEPILNFLQNGLVFPT